MATCENCIHYGVCTFHVKGDENNGCPHYINTADVVPRSEVEKWKEEAEQCYSDTAIMREYTVNQIFGDIEQWFDTRIDFYKEMKFKASLGFDEERYKYAKTFITNLQIYREEIAEIKKKYTEEK